VPAEHAKPNEGNAGIALSEFEAAVDTLEQLQRSGKFQIFLAREHSIRFIGETDEFRVAFGKRLGIELVEKKKAQECLDELQIFLQAVIAVPKLESTAKIFEEQVYDEDFTNAKEDTDRLNGLRKIIETKISLIATKLASDAMRERARRLATAVGAIMEDVDIEIISKRQNLVQGLEIEAPFLRLGLRHTTGSDSKYPFPLPPWFTNRPKDFKSFELECDENDIDLLISRLLRAKDLLSKSLGVKVKSSITESK
jgi:hypothetical protein